MKTSILVVAVILVASIVAMYVNADSLQTKNGQLSIPRSAFGCAPDKITNKIYCFGGEDAITRNKIEQYDPQLDVTSMVNAQFPSQREFVPCVTSSVTNKIYCFGGFVAGTPINQITEYDPVADQLVIKTTVLPTPRYAFSCAESSQVKKIYCFGGQVSQTTGTNQIIAYDPVQDTLTVQTATMPKTTILSSCTEQRNKIYCFGGYNFSSFFNQIIEYDPLTDLLAVKNAVLPTGRIHHACVAGKGDKFIYCFGGRNDLLQQRYQDILRYNIKQDRINIQQAQFPLPILGLSCAKSPMGKSIFCFGGTNTEPALYLRQIVEYKP